ncbi:hypothetical protein [Haloprofundus halobius]|nr:hypothetical protein [Haloprofundus halobius]
MNGTDPSTAFDRERIHAAETRERNRADRGRPVGARTACTARFGVDSA